MLPYLLSHHSEQMPVTNNLRRAYFMSWSQELGHECRIAAHIQMKSVNKMLELFLIHSIQDVNPWMEHV